MSTSSADTVVLSWGKSEHRENGQQITGETTFELVVNNVLSYEGAEQTHSIDVETGKPYVVEIYQLEDGLRSKPSIKSIYIDRVPPLSPPLDE